MANFGTDDAMTERWKQHDTHGGERWFTYEGRGHSNGQKVRDGDILRVHGRYRGEQVQEGTAQITHVELQHREGLAVLVAWDVAGGQHMVRQAPTADDPRPVLIPAPKRKPPKPEFEPERVPWTKDGCVICGYVGRNNVENAPFGPVCTGVCKRRANRLLRYGAQHPEQYGRRAK